VRSASDVRTDDPRRERGTGRAESGVAGPENSGVCCRYNERVHPWAGKPAGLRRVSGHGTPCATTGPGRYDSDRSAYSVCVNRVEVYQESQEQAAGMLAMQWHRSSQETVPMEACQGGGRQTRLEGLCSSRKRQRQQTGCDVDTHIGS
jgi:hypothetical protein